MSWKCRHCGHEARTEESCCWEHWDEAASNREKFAIVLAFSALVIVMVVCAILFTLGAGDG